MVHSIGPPISGLGFLPRYGGGWMHQFGHIYALQLELLNPKRHDWFRAMELWHIARDEGLTMNVSHYNNILRQCVPTGAWQAALQVLWQMRRDAIRPDVVGVGCAMAACVDSGQYDMVEKVFHEYDGRLKLDSICYLARIRALLRQGCYKAAFGVGIAQSVNGIMWLPATCDALLEASVEMKDLESMQLVFSQMKSACHRIQEPISGFHQTLLPSHGLQWPIHPCIRKKVDSFLFEVNCKLEFLEHDGFQVVPLISLPTSNETSLPEN